MTRLSAAALDLLRREGSKHPDVRARQRDILRDAESQPAAERWRRLDDIERRSLLAYLVDDAQEYPEHYPANVAAIGLLLAALDNAKGTSHTAKPNTRKPRNVVRG